MRRSTFLTLYSPCSIICPRQLLPLRLHIEARAGGTHQQGEAARISKVGAVDVARDRLPLRAPEETITSEGRADGRHLLQHRMGLDVQGGNERGDQSGGLDHTRMFEAQSSAPFAVPRHSRDHPPVLGQGEHCQVSNRVHGRRGQVSLRSR